MKKAIQVTQSSMPDFEDFTEEIRDLWNSRWLTNTGKKHQKLEESLKEYLNTSNISLFTNGHSALESAIALFDLSGEVITTPFTFASTTHAIVRNGLTPVFCDINFKDYTIDIEKLENLITEKTSAIVPVHVYGNVCNVKEIERIAEKYDLKIIYDAAHTFGVTVDGESIANFGDVSMFSFHATKVFNTIEGGALTYRDPDFSTKLDAQKNFGISGPDTIEYVGTNAKMNEFQAAMGLCNLKIVDREIQKRKDIVARYNENLNNLTGLKLPVSQVGVKSNYAYYPILIDGYKLSRDEIYDVLKKENIFARKYFYPLTNSFECFQGEFNTEDTPVAKYVSERILTLPLYADLELADVDRICKVIKDV
ncbi:DegT/DnrJ/EryC1/StrS family aminotransferase [Bacilli bacterium]|nr:aminotransferase [Bacilli bacterium VT-13-104]PZD84324.1 DegT/DnrJ/EryC1/StrS family aminotransferase [Bacilli bacterium]PZD86017.1 DegT/DnrJ/EryC1/StrS family aminotransferase [Bacilli bacterium]PZD89239.1 DegT/DnrJ/EryC1/StrS family aminotransferase [Bacilli bacterium]RCO05205.1 DegT/DnrJ/EryC1/StrS family aminotransferase [Bacilli bacterium]